MYQQSSDMKLEQRMFQYTYITDIPCMYSRQISKSNFPLLFTIHVRTAIFRQYIARVERIFSRQLNCTQKNGHAIFCVNRALISVEIGDSYQSSYIKGISNTPIAERKQLYLKNVISFLKKNYVIKVKFASDRQLKHSVILQFNLCVSQIKL